MLLYRIERVLRQSTEIPDCPFPFVFLVFFGVSRFGFSPASRKEAVATENPCSRYRVGRIVHGYLPPYAARMDCSLNVPTYRAGAGSNTTGSCFSPSLCPRTGISIRGYIVNGIVFEGAAI